MTSKFNTFFFNLKMCLIAVATKWLVQLAAPHGPCPGCVPFSLPTPPKGISDTASSLLARVTLGANC